MTKTNTVTANNGVDKILSKLSLFLIFVSSGDDDDDKIELATEAEKRVKTASVIFKEVLSSDIFKTIL